MDQTKTVFPRFEDEALEDPEVTELLICTAIFLQDSSPSYKYLQDSLPSHILVDEDEVLENEHLASYESPVEWSLPESSSDAESSSTDPRVKYYYQPYHKKHVKPARITRDDTFKFDFKLGEGVKSYECTPRNIQARFIFEYAQRSCTKASDKAYRQVFASLGLDPVLTKAIKDGRGIYQDDSHEDLSPPASPAPEASSELKVTLPLFS